MSTSFVSGYIFDQVVKQNAKVDREMDQLQPQPRPLPQTDTETDTDNKTNATSWDWSRWPTVTVMIPARNEQANILACLETVVTEAQNYAGVVNILVIDDDSTDATFNLVSDYAKTNANANATNLTLTVIKASKTRTDGEGEGEGEKELEWVGKNNALWSGYEYITTNTNKPKSDGGGDWILFLDADTRLKSGALAGGVAYAIHHQYDLLSLAPGSYENSVTHKILFAQLAKLYGLAAMLTSNPSKPDAPESAAANGAYILVRQDAYAKVGGHKAIAQSVLEDVDLARNFRRLGGYRTLMNGTSSHISQVQNVSLGEFWESMTKNWFLVAQKNWLAAAGVLAFEFFHGGVPIILLLLKVFGSGRGRAGTATKAATEYEYEHKHKYKNNKKPPTSTSTPNLLADIVAIVLFLIGYSIIIGTYKIKRSYALLYPIAAVIDALVIIVSVIKVGVVKRATWKGRTVKID